jgi:hypothetical protein
MKTVPLKKGKVIGTQKAPLRGLVVGQTALKFGLNLYKSTIKGNKNEGNLPTI